MKLIDIDHIKNEILSGEESRIYRALAQGRAVGFDADKYLDDLLEICNFMETKRKKLYSLPRLKAEISGYGLDLNGLNLEQLPSCFGALNEMAEIVDLSNNQFTEFPKIILEFKKLKRLNLSGNQLINFPEAFAAFHSLTALDLSSNHFVQLPKVLEKLDKLKVLSINCRHDLFFEACDLKKLEKLHIVLGKNVKFPEAIFDFTSLKILHLEGISAVHASMHKLHYLEELIIENAGIENLVGAILKLPNLKKLRLCKLVLMNELPELIYDLNSLEELDLSDTPLKELPARLRHLKNLKRIQLKGCSDEKTLELWKKRCESWGISCCIN